MKDNLLRYDILVLSLNHSHLQIHLIPSFPNTYLIHCDISINQSLYQEMNEQLTSLSHSKSLIDLEKIGKTLFRLIFLDEKGTPLHGLDALFYNDYPLILFLNGELENWPIELLHNGHEFLFLKRMVARGLFGLAKQVDFKKEKSILIIADPLDNSDNSYKEGRALFENLNSQFSDRFSQIDFFSKELSKIEMNNLLEQYNIIHFAGHGEFQPGEDGGLLIAKNVQFQVGDLLSLKSPPELIFINACMSAKSNIRTQNSLVKKLLLEGVKNVIASQWIILDDDFSSFILEFYGYLLSSKSIGESLYEVRKSNFSNGDTKWLYYSLFGHPNQRYF